MRMTITFWNVLIVCLPHLNIKYLLSEKYFYCWEPSKNNKTAGVKQVSLLLLGVWTRRSVIMKKWILASTNFDDIFRFRQIQIIKYITVVSLMNNGDKSLRGYRVKNQECLADNTVSDNGRRLTVNVSQPLALQCTANERLSWEDWSVCGFGNRHEHLRKQKKKKDVSKYIDTSMRLL